MPRGAFVLKIQRELCHPNCARKVSIMAMSTPAPMVRKSVQYEQRQHFSGLQPKWKNHNETTKEKTQKIHTNNSAGKT